MTLLQVLGSQSHDVKAGHEKDCSLHETGRWLSADCFYASHSIFPGIGQSVLCLCCGRVCLLCTTAAQVSHTDSLTSAHFLSIECCEGKHQNRFVFCLRNDFIWRIHQMYASTIFLDFSYHTGLLHLTNDHWGSETETFHLVKRPLDYKISSSPRLNIPAPSLWRHAPDAWQSQCNVVTG